MGLHSQKAKTTKFVRSNQLRVFFNNIENAEKEVIFALLWSQKLHPFIIQ